MQYSARRTLQQRIKDGFSIIEIMIVIAIIAIMASVLVPNLQRYLQSSKKSAATGTIRALKGAIDMFNAHVGRFPASLNELIKKPTDERAAKKWEGPYIEKKEIPTDPWGEKFKYQLTPQAEHPYELYSYGQNMRGAPKSEWISVWDL